MNIVFVAIYEHGYGEDVRVFNTLSAAADWRDKIALDWWEKEFPDNEVPTENVGKTYFELMSANDGREAFYVHQCTVEVAA